MKTNLLLKSSAVALLLFSLAGAITAAQQEVTATFTNAFGDGIWRRDAHIGVIGNINDPSTPGNWSTGAYPNYNHVIQDPNTGIYSPNPNPDYDVVIALPLTCTIEPVSLSPLSILSLNISAVSTLNLTGPASTLLAISGGSIVNNGSILVNSDDPVNGDAAIRFDNTSTGTISGSGSIQLNGASYGRSVLQASATKVTVANGQTIHGRGDLLTAGGAWINNGVINADVNGDAHGINFYFADHATNSFNNATIEATNGGLLLFGNGVIDQTGGGTFLADGADSIVQLGISGPSYVFYLIGGIVTTANGGIVEGVYGNMESVTNNGDFRIPGNDIVTITGSGLTNNGTVVINSNDPINSNSVIRFDADGTLGGTGSLRLDGASYGRATLGFSSHTVSIGSSQTVHGRGTINTAGGSMINQGTIDADVNGDASGIQLYFADSASGQQNQGTIEATNGGFLLFGNGTITQSGSGKFLADGANSVVQLGISGPSYVFFLKNGVVTTSNGGVIEGVYGNMDSVTNNGTFHIPGGDIVTITGSGLTDNGTILVNSTDPDNSTSTVRYDATGALDGTGVMTLNGNVGGRGDLIIGDTFTMTQGSSHTINGKGDIAGNGGVTFVNNGTVNANATPRGIDISGGMSVTNNNLLEATNGSTIAFDRVNVDQTGGGTILATGSSSKVQLGGSFYGHITGGILNGTTGGIVSSVASQLDGSITNSGSYETPANGITLLYATNLTNNGTMTINDNTALFRFDTNNTAIDGIGSIVLTNNAQMIVNGGQAVTNGSNHTIKGSGTIGIAGGGSLINNGTIAPGLSPGQLNVNGNLQINFPAKLSFEIGGTTPATQFDVLNSASILSLNGKLILNLINGFIPQSTDTFTIVTTPSVLGGNFTNVKSGGRMNTEDGSGSFQVDYHVLNNTPLSQKVTLSNFGPVLPPSQGLNISTRAEVGTGENVAIGGFIINGTDPKKVIIRGIGPSLSGQGVPTPLADPILQLNDASHTIASNDNWKDTQQTEIQNSGLAPGNDSESAIIATLGPGNYTATLSGTNSSTGIGLIEVYDLNPAANSRLGNISTRGFVGTGDSVLIGGTIIGPSTGNSSPVLVRAMGPSLGSQGVVNPLPDPTLELHDANGAIFAFNDNWKDVQQSQIEATGLTPNNDSESAIFLALAPSNWTAIVRGKNGTTGVALVEVYNIQ
jgi:hypothetical protein